MKTLRIHHMIDNVCDNLALNLRPIYYISRTFKTITELCKNIINDLRAIYTGDNIYILPIVIMYFCPEKTFFVVVWFWITHTKCGGLYVFENATLRENVKYRTAIKIQNKKSFFWNDKFISWNKSNE